MYVQFSTYIFLSHQILSFFMTIVCAILCDLILALDVRLYLSDRDELL